MNKENLIAKAKELLVGMKIGFNIVYGACAIYGMYQIILKMDKITKVLEIAQK